MNDYFKAALWICTPLMGVGYIINSPDIMMFSSIIFLGCFLAGLIYKTPVFPGKNNDSLPQ